MYIVYRIMSEIHGLTELLKVKTVDLSVHLTLMNALKHRVHMSIINLMSVLLQTPPPNVPSPFHSTERVFGR